MKRYYNTLTIAGFDGSGGAGIQADLKTFAALECYGLSVLTALPIQNTTGVKSVYSIPDQCISEQLQALFEDIEIDAVKIGMLHRPEIIDIIVGMIDRYSLKKIVLDPVMLSKNGASLLSPDAIQLMKEKLLPRVTVITPNLSESSMLLQREVGTKAEMEQAALELVAMGPQAVVVKGGHLVEKASHRMCEDCLCIRDPLPAIHWFSAPRIITKNTHGTGCTFSAALTAHLAKGDSILESVQSAKKYIASCIDAGADYSIGRGNGPLHHFHHFWR